MFHFCQAYCLDSNCFEELCPKICIRIIFIERLTFDFPKEINIFPNKSCSLGQVFLISFLSLVH